MACAIGKIYMKNYLLYVVMWFIFIPMHATSQELFLQGNKEYENHNYQLAFDLYEQIKNKGEAILYNIGNCCFALGRYPEALMYWYKTEQSWPAPSTFYNIQNNKQKAYEALNFYPEQSTVEYIMQYMTYYLLYLSIFAWQLLFLVIWYMSLFFCVVLWYKKRWVRMIVLSVFLCMISFLMIIFYLHYYKPKAISLAPSVLKVGPDKGFGTKQNIKEGQLVYVQEKQGEWLRVKYDHQEGWVEAHDMVLI